jgi:hypothetical protein
MSAAKAHLGLGRWPHLLVEHSVEWAFRGIAIARKSWLLGGSYRGGQHTAIMLA